jgi:acid phosphatase class B
MTPKEKAKELVRKYWDLGGIDVLEAKQCALIAVDEILDVDYFDMSEEHFENIMEYWEQVKNEIKKAMTPKEKAKELVDKFINSNNMIFLIEGAKECALIAVDEILLINKLQDIESQKYWQEVKQEIENYGK